MKAHSKVFQNYENIGLYLLKGMQDVRRPDGSAMPVLNSYSQDIHKTHEHCLSAHPDIITPFQCRPTLHRYVTVTQHVLKLQQNILRANANGLHTMTNGPGAQ